MAESKSETKHQTKAEKKKEKREKMKKVRDRQARIETARTVGKGVREGLIALGVLLFIAGMFVLFWNLLIVKMVTVAVPIDYWLAFWFIVIGGCLMLFYVTLLRAKSEDYW